MRTSSTVAAVLLAVGAACSPTISRPPAPAVPPKALFEPYPVEQIAHVKDPHDYQGKALCQRCHYLDGKLTAGPNQLCGGCHHFGHKNHPLEVVQKEPAQGLPLLEGGKVACHTCHDPHQKKSVLRKPFNELCRTCHMRH